ncbi:hypothetical protein BGP81_22345 [Pseudomonas putida]|nr:hypothetical protein BGP81_22345 [Pseudomonas putida]
MLAFMIMHVAFATAMLVATTGSDHHLVLLSIELRQLIQERDDAPDVLIVHALAPSWHACGFDAVLDGPECSCRIATYADLGEVWRRWVEGLAEFCFLHPRSEVASDTHGVVIACPCLDKSRIFKIWDLNVACTDFN